MCGAPTAVTLVVEYPRRIRRGRRALSIWAETNLANLTNVSVSGFETGATDTRPPVADLEARAEGMPTTTLPIRAAVDGALPLTLRLFAWDDNGNRRLYEGANTLRSFEEDPSKGHGDVIISVDGDFVGDVQNISGRVREQSANDDTCLALIRLRLVEFSGGEEQERLARKYFDMGDATEAWTMLRPLLIENRISPPGRELFREIQGKLTPRILEKIQHLAGRGELEVIARVLEEDGHILGNATTQEWRDNLALFEREMDRGRENLSMGLYSKAARCVERARKIFPDHPEARQLQAFLDEAPRIKEALDSENPAEARQRAARLLGDPNGERLAQDVFRQEAAPKNLGLATDKEDPEGAPLPTEYYLLTGAVMRVGRSSNCEVMVFDRLQGPKVGRFHARILRKGSGFYLSMDRLGRKTGELDPKGPTRTVILDGDRLTSPPASDTATGSLSDQEFSERYHRLRPGQTLAFGEDRPDDPGPGQFLFQVRSAGIGGDSSTLMLVNTQVPHDRADAFDSARYVLFGERGTLWGLDKWGRFACGEDATDPKGYIQSRDGWLVLFFDEDRPPVVLDPGHHDLDCVPIEVFEPSE